MIYTSITWISILNLINFDYIILLTSLISFSERFHRGQHAICPDWSAPAGLNPWVLSASDYQTLLHPSITDDVLLGCKVWECPSFQQEYKEVETQVQKGVGKCRLSTLATVVTSIFHVRFLCIVKVPQEVRVDCFFHHSTWNELREYVNVRCNFSLYTERITWITLDLRDESNDDTLNKTIYILYHQELLNIFIPVPSLIHQADGSPLVGCTTRTNNRVNDHFIHRARLDYKRPRTKELLAHSTSPVLQHVLSLSITHLHLHDIPRK